MGLGAVGVEAPQWADRAIMMISVFDTVRSELRDAQALDRPVVWIRVSPDALRGSVVTTPVTPERLRTMALREVQDGQGSSVGVIADPDIAERAMEIVMHPEDWRDLLTDAEAYGAVEFAHGAPFSEHPRSALKRVMGVHVIDY
jgi:hypothetical protein